MPQNVGLVAIRRRRWRVTDVRTYEACRLLTVTPPGAADAHLHTFLTPFDDVVQIAVERRTRSVGRTKWRFACRNLFAETTPPGGIRSVRTANLDVLPHQLEPALAIVRGACTRVLLADEVGLGKTIQAGIIAAELFARGAIERMLVLCPAGLRDQWADELTTRFLLPADIVDAAALRRTIGTLPIGVNPWTTKHLVVVSQDYAKRADILPSLAAHGWDLVVVDEAHGAAGDSERRAAVHALASNAAYVVLLTATPHSGDARTFAALCELGSVENDPLLIFRRRRRDIRPSAQRRVHALFVRASEHERRMHTLLSRYTTAVCKERPDAWLSASVLHKRALSSPWSLARSLERRISALTEAARPNIGEGQDEQLVFSFDADGERTADDAAPAWPSTVGLANAERELRLLAVVKDAAELAAAHSTKIGALRRLLRRCDEPAIVFTEYRDTLLHVRSQVPFACAVLHGGLDRHERAAALSDFRAGVCRVLLATDAGGEGLNLQATSRLVINLELPWNPIRLEQRIGRVDRIGQHRRVHAVHLIAAATSETRVLDRLRSRIAAAQASLGAADPLGAYEERTAARIVVHGRMDPTDDDIEPPAPTIDSTTALAEAGVVEAARVDAARRLSPRRSQIADDIEATGPWLTTASPPTSCVLEHSLAVVFRAVLAGDGEKPIETNTVVVRLDAAGDGIAWTRTAVDRLLSAVDGELRRCVADAITEWRVHAEATCSAFWRARLAREQAIRDVAPSRQLFQPGLFDRRAERMQAAVDAARQEGDADRATRIAAIERGLGSIRMSIVPMLVLAPRAC